MAHVIPFDTLAFVKRLKDAGVPEVQAEAHAETMKMVQASQLEELVTRRDLKDMEAATKADILDLKRDIKELEYRMTIKLGTLIVAAVGLLFAALRYFPPTH
ncbi:MAG: DUF1640 domain-containing protein [Magnetococcales bacterium]|nr:DUF1640 domain-containing protein [Magnetococcales bacterium]NGZ27089.1 DUF1640 domain-containing protein [Magnetococcales bacterium]